MRRSIPAYYLVTMKVHTFNLFVEFKLIHPTL